SEEFGRGTPQTVVRADQQVTALRAHHDGPPRRAHSGIHHRDVDAHRKVRNGRPQQERAFMDREGGHRMAQIQDACLGADAPHDAATDAWSRRALPEVREERDERSRHGCAISLAGARLMRRRAPLATPSRDAALPWLSASARWPEESMYTSDEPSPTAPKVVAKGSSSTRGSPPASSIVSTRRARPSVTSPSPCTRSCAPPANRRLPKLST